jgi:hypothetical protein
MNSRRLGQMTSQKNCTKDLLRSLLKEFLFCDVVGYAEKIRQRDIPAMLLSFVKAKAKHVAVL